MDKTVKLSTTTLAIAVINIVIFAMAFIVPIIALTFAIAVFAILVILVCLGKILRVTSCMFLKNLQETTNKIEDDAEREKQHMKNAVTVIVMVFMWLVYFMEFYKTWRRWLLGLVLSSLIAIMVIVYSDLCEIGQHLTTFLYIVMIYTFMRLLVHFTLNPFGENAALNKFPHFLKILLEAARIVLIIMAVIGEDGTLTISWLSPSILMSVVATIAIDTIMATLEKIGPKPKNTDAPENQ
ncbi:MAG: hypothetical protein FWC78_03070 [Defluviitaleaceae bacterium]|nr:hypothetical protein [Defluviitaleaceae bacterium]